MGFWVLELYRTSMLMSRLLCYVPTEVLQGILLSAVLLPHLYIHTQWRTLVTAHVQHPPPPYPNTPPPCSAKTGKSKNSKHRRLTPGKTRMREWGEKLLQSKIAETLLFDQAIHRTQLKQNLPRCHENLILTPTFYDLLCQSFI